MADSSDQTLAVFLVSDNEGAERLLKAVQGIDEADPNVKIVDSAIAEHTKHGRVKIHQEEQVGTGRTAMRAGAIGVVVGAILLGPVRRRGRWRGRCRPGRRAQQAPRLRHRRQDDEAGRG